MDAKKQKLKPFNLNLCLSCVLITETENFIFQGLIGAAEHILGSSPIIKQNCTLQYREDIFKIVCTHVDRPSENADLQRCSDCVWNYPPSLVAVSHEEEHLMAENVNIPEGNSLFSLSTELISHARLLC